MSERGEAKRDNAKLHKNSGRNTTKGDATWNQFVVDYKEFSKTFGLSKSVWAKAVTDAIKAGRDKSPVIKVILGDGGNKIRLAVIEWELLEQLLEEQE